ncbi:MAG: HRDC domain-containing protein [Candidatus Acidiferrales bacterium]
MDPELSEYLREWRRSVAKQQGLAAFVVMHDTTLEELCRMRPASRGELLQVPGIGERKAELYGRQILGALERFRKGARVTAISTIKSKPAMETMRLLAQGRTFEEIAQIRGRQISSVVSMVADLVLKGDLEFQPSWIPPERLPKIEAACAERGTGRLQPIKEALPPEFTYNEIRLVVARLRSESELSSTASKDSGAK